VEDIGLYLLLPDCPEVQELGRRYFHALTLDAAMATSENLADPCRIVLMADLRLPKGVEGVK